ncbi:MAG TPA: toll/interleukin-1 receptor domain-containing protein, partial [Pyrinomonadaceae bacterium]|nr:toll/interleukin-1 receptor domain-containing protein [Pyrinomonadaceae bacterium]
KWEKVKGRFREVAQIVLASERKKLNQFAATLGLEIVSLELDRRSPSHDVELHEKKIEAIEKAITNVARGIDTPDDLRRAFELLKEDRLRGDIERDLVACSVFAPRTAPRGSSILVQVFAHLEKDAAVAKAMAAEFDEQAKPLAHKRLDHEVERGTKLVFCISIPGLQVEEPVQELIWRGPPESVQFAIRIPKDFLDNEIIGTVYVTQDSMPFGHVKFLLRIETTETTQEGEAPKTWKRYEYAFISYASPDRSEVLKRVQMLSRLHIDYFQDVLTLEPGDRWANALYKNIDRSDVFFLFWSSAARNSEWVMKEVRYALERKGVDEFAAPEIVPIIIEGPPPVPPPDELKHIHFNDAFIYFIK